MKSFALGAIASVLMTSTAIGADAIVYDAAPEVAVSTYNWSGFYAGGNVGYGWGDLDFAADDTAFDFLAVEPPPGAVGSLDVDGVLGGVQAGYNWQAGNFVFGAEADYAWSGVEGEGTAFDETSPSPSVPSFEVDSVATLRARLGYAADRILFYGTVGGAWAEVDGTITNLQGAGDDRTASNSHFGWVAGAGVEVGVTQNVSAKFEYLYHDFGSETYNFGDFYAVDNELTADADFDLSVIKFGVNVRF